MRVSAVIAAHNAADYLREAIESIIAQTYRPFEIIVVDDGSIDHTREVCASFGEQVRYLYQPKDEKNYGGSATIRCLLESSGEFIAYMNHDDRWLPTKIEKQVEALDANPEVGVVFTGTRAIDKDGNIFWDPMPHGPSGDVFHSLLKRSFYFPSSALIRRSALPRAGLPEPNAIGGDWDLWLRIARYYPVLVIEESLTEYRSFEGNFSKKKELLFAGRLELLQRQSKNLHPSCSECTTTLAESFRTMSGECLEYYHLRSRDSEFARALPFLRLAYRFSRREVLRPERLLSILKDAVFAKVRETGLLKRR
jgi:glycosyltransferase involved in cell wall biosynthesis